MPKALALGGNFYVSESLPIAAQEAINVYACVPQAPTTTELFLVTTPGIELATTAGDTVNRGSHVFLGVPYFVQGDELYRIDRTFDIDNNPVYTSVLVSGVTTLPGLARVVMADNGTEGGQMMIVCPDVATQFNTYIYTTGGGLVAVSDSDFDGPASSVVFVDGYFLFTKVDSQVFFISDLRDGAAYNALDFASAEADPDSIIAPAIIRNSPYIFGESTFEPYQNVGGSGFPFVRVQGGVQRKGLNSAYGYAEVNDLLIFLGSADNETPMIWITDGGTVTKLSTPPIDRLLRTYTQETIEASYAWKYSQDGAQFVCFTFPGERCFVYDFTSKLWHTRVSRDDDEDQTCRVASIVDAYGVLMVGDTLSNQIGVLSRDVYTEYDELMTREFVMPQLDNEGDPFFVGTIELVCDTGEGLTSGQGSDPEVLMSYSKDGGRTFCDGRARSAGAIGDYWTRVIWNRLGRVAREICFKFYTTDPIKWVFRKVEASIE